MLVTRIIKFFYNAMKLRSALNMIKEIQCVSGELVSIQKEIKKEAVQFYSTFLNYVPPDYVETAVSDLGALLNFRCNEADNLMLGQEVTAEEMVLFAMPSHSRQVPMGILVSFLKLLWIY